MYETPDAVVVLVELAGIHGDSVHIGVEGKSLRLTGTRIPRFSSSYRQFHQLEIPQGKFERVIELPRAVNVEASRAEYLDGFLEIVLPLARPVRVQVAPGKREGA
jgi:HSP20 family protein